MTKVDLVVTVMTQGKASVISVIEGDDGYIACSESSVVSTLSKEEKDAELRSLPRAGESGTRRYEGGKARSRERWGGRRVYVMAGCIWGLSAGRGIVENSDCGVGGAVNDDALESENVGDGVRGLGGGESSATLWAAFTVGYKTRICLPCMTSGRLFGWGVVVVVRVKGGTSVENLRGTVLYIFIGSVVQLTLLKMEYIQGLRLQPV